MTTTVATALGGGPFCAARADTPKGSDRFEKLANSVCWKASLGLGYLLKSCANAEECEWKIAVWSCHVASVKNVWFSIFLSLSRSFSLLPSHSLLSSSSAPQSSPLFLLFPFPLSLSVSHHLCFNAPILLPTCPPPSLLCVFAFLSFSHPPNNPPTPLPPLPLFFQLSGRGYLRLRIHKTRLRCVCFCYFPKMVQWLPHCLLLILIQPLPVKRRASCGLAVTRGLDGALPSVGFR